MSEIADLRGYRCPLPALKLRARMKDIAPGTMIDVLTDDPLAAIDIPAFCNEAGHIIVEQVSGDGDEVRFRVKRS